MFENLCLAHDRFAEGLVTERRLTRAASEATDFADESFDLIVSHILLHETSHKAVYNIMRECHRLLRPGGMVVHGDVPFFNQQSDAPVAGEFSERHYNAEPFWGRLHDMDLRAPAEKAGFARDAIILDNSAARGVPWLVYGATK